ncbi:MAG TPA: ATP-binding protein [Gammaproteobacteria bacterium]
MVAQRTSVHGKLLLLVLATTASALLITGAAMVTYDLYTFRLTWVADLTAQADILGLAAAPALEFEDAESAEEYLELLQAKPNIMGAAIYTATGALFAEYQAAGQAGLPFPHLPDLDGYNIKGGELTLFKRIVADREILGTVYIKARYGIVGRLLDYLGIVGAVAVLSLLAAVLISRQLQKSVTGPIREITSVARKVVDDRDFSARASRTTDDEIGVLVDAFNGMLSEIANRTQVLEESNLHLGREIAERERTEEALHASENRLRSLNTELEERVAARTAQLEAANKDLEGFSYSVSHDLRAPIRAISGFCTLLVEDHKHQLDEEASRKLGIIAAESERMGRLIDDLLAFSRLGRKALDPAELDMSELVRDALERLNHTGQNRKIDFRVGSMPRARGDRSLFEQVWINLLSNAIKFSSKKDAPVIEVGGISEQQEHVYFVRDNGAGFDGRYQGRLFGVFQRLHHDHEFPGTGVGLALVHRIVTRHGGRVWADGKLDEGATFHFTLPKGASDGRV